MTDDIRGKDDGKLLYCSFCGKSQHEVRKLIAGPSVFVCDECVELCNDIIREELEEKQERPDEAKCWLQVEPARKLARWKNIKTLSISADGTYHRTYDPCIPKFLKQAGVDNTFIRLEDVGISGNSHMMMLEKNSDQVIGFITDWLQKNVLTVGSTSTR